MPSLTESRKFTNVKLVQLGNKKETDVTATIGQQLVILSDGGKEVFNFDVSDVFCLSLDESSIALRPCGANSNVKSTILKFNSPQDLGEFSEFFAKQGINGSSVFDQRTEKSSANQYFQVYGYLSQQQNMMKDVVRTSTYQKAMLSNVSDFKDKVVLDVGAGNGILSFFAAQAGARRVYAVEGSSMATHCKSLVESNGLSSVIQIVSGRLEDIKLPEQVDVIVSEPLGYMLINERMLESFLHAKKFLKPGGKMYPTQGDLHIAPFTDEALFAEQTAKANFWCQEHFYGVNLTAIKNEATRQYFSQPVKDTWEIDILMARSHLWSIDFSNAEEKDLLEIEIPFEFDLNSTGIIHGLGFWFDVAFIGTDETVWLSTAPSQPDTHWHQVRCLFEQPIFGKTGQKCKGKVEMIANARQSYDLSMEMCIEGNEAKAIIDLKNPYFRYKGPVSRQPSANGNVSPTEAQYNSIDKGEMRKIYKNHESNAVNGVDALGAGGFGEN